MKKAVFIIDIDSGAGVFGGNEVLEFSQETLLVLAGFKFHVVFITARPEADREVMQVWLQKYSLSYDQLIMGLPNNVVMAALIEAHSADIVVVCDDFGESAELFAKAGAFVFLFDKPWNQKILTSRRLRRITGWKDLCALIKWHHLRVAQDFVWLF